MAAQEGPGRRVCASTTSWLKEAAATGNAWGGPSMRWIARQELLRLEYDVELVPDGGQAVLLSAAAPVKLQNKDAAGHLFHEWALKQSGLLGGCLL